MLLCFITDTEMGESHENYFFFDRILTEDFSIVIRTFTYIVKSYIRIVFDICRNNNILLLYLISKVEFFVWWEIDSVHIGLTNVMIPKYIRILI